MQETKVMRVRSLSAEGPLEEGMATHSSILAWRIPWTEEPGGLESMGSQRVRHDWSNLACRGELRAEEGRHGSVLYTVFIFLSPLMVPFVFLSCLRRELSSFLSCSIVTKSKSKSSEEKPQRFTFRLKKSHISWKHSKVFTNAIDKNVHHWTHTSSLKGLFQDAVRSRNPQAARAAGK